MKHGLLCMVALIIAMACSFYGGWLSNVIYQEVNSTDFRNEIWFFEYCKECHLDWADMVKQYPSIGSSTERELLLAEIYQQIIDKLR